MGRIGRAMAGLPKCQILPNRNMKLCAPQRRNLKSSGLVRSEAARQKTSSDAVSLNLSHSSSSSQGEQDQPTRLPLSNKDSKIVLPPRLCTLRAFGKSGDGIVKAEPDRMSSFFNSLIATIDHCAEIKDWEILSGRLAMIVFAAAVNVELLTGNSLFQKMDVLKICQIGAVCMASILSAAAFAWASRAKSQVAIMVSKRCNDFVDSVIDQLVDGLFYEDEGSHLSK